MRAILIDPKLRRVVDVELSDKDMLADMRRLIGCASMDHQTISDEHDSIWCDDTVLIRGDPCFAFKLGREGVNLGPFGGTCIIIGADDRGRSRPPFVPIAMIANDIDWLDEIVPQVDWVEEPLIVNGIDIGFRRRAVVTYARPSRH